MLHFPLQITLAVVLAVTGFSPTWFQSAEGQVVFFVVLIVISSASFHRFERPIQAALRRRFLGARK
jgi:hypothetical protein